MDKEIISIHVVAVHMCDKIQQRKGAVCVGFAQAVFEQVAFQNLNGQKKNAAR
jgi:hypothetical protein